MKIPDDICGTNSMCIVESSELRWQLNHEKQDVDNKLSLYKQVIYNLQNKITISILTKSVNIFFFYR